MSLIPKLTSAAKIQRNYKRIVEQAKETKEPIVILRRNTPEAAIVDIETFEEISRKAESFDEIKAIEAIEQSEKEYRSGQAKKLTSLKNLLDEY